MLGLEGVAVPLGILLTLSSTVLCVIYGLKNWNKGYITEEEIAQEKEWLEENNRVKKNL